MIIAASTYFNRGPVTAPADPLIAVTNVASDVIYRLGLLFAYAHFLQKRGMQRPMQDCLPLVVPTSLFSTHKFALVCFCSPDASDQSAVCERGCGNGVCISYNTCSCNAGYAGATCETRLSLFDFLLSACSCLSLWLSPTGRILHPAVYMHVSRRLAGQQLLHGCAWILFSSFLTSSNLPSQLHDMLNANNVHFLRRWQDWHKLHTR